MVTAASVFDALCLKHWRSVLINNTSVKLWLAVSAVTSLMMSFKMQRCSSDGQSNNGNNANFHAIRRAASFMCQPDASGALCICS